MTKKSRPTLLLVKSDGCGFCQMFQPTWDTLSEFLKHSKISTEMHTFDTLDQVENAALKKFAKTQATYVPFLALLTADNEVHVYSGERELPNIILFILDKLVE